MKKSGFARRSAAAVLLWLLTLRAAAAPTYLIVGGRAVGIKLYTQGLLVTEVEADSPAQRAGIHKGDLLVSVNGKPCEDPKSLRLELEDGNGIILQIRRGDRQAEYLLNPEKTESGFRIGLVLRDNIAGIGTITYYDPLTGNYGALGHGVNDASGTNLLKIREGLLVPADVAQVEKGKTGAPGQLEGEFDTDRIIGNVEKNTHSGIFGVMATPQSGQTIRIAQIGQAHTGKAVIVSNVQAEQSEEFEVDILKIDADAEDGRNFFLEVTDQKLLSITGGIVQGMSGSPILQDGRLIGAVTHVLVNDPTRGYGIGIEKMLAEGEPDGMDEGRLAG